MACLRRLLLLASYIACATVLAAPATAAVLTPLRRPSSGSATPLERKHTVTRQLRQPLKAATAKRSAANLKDKKKHSAVAVVMAAAVARRARAGKLKTQAPGAAAAVGAVPLVAGKLPAGAAQYTGALQPCLCDRVLGCNSSQITCAHYRTTCLIE